MNFLDIQKTLETELQSFWGYTSPIFWENVQTSESSVSDLYIAPTVEPNINDPIEYGSCRTINSMGIFNIRVVGKFNEGSGNVLTKADLLLNHFSDKVFSNVHTEVGSIQKIGVQDNKYQVNVLIPYNSYQN